MRIPIPGLKSLPALILLGAWQWFVSGDPQRLFFFGSPVQIAQVAIEELPHVAIWKDIGATFSAVVTGLVLGTILGTLGGLILSLHKGSRALMKPYLVFFASIQIFTIAPLLIIWFGIGWEAKVAMALLSTCFVALHQVASGLDVGDEGYLTYPRSLRASPVRVLWHITLPGAMQWVMAGLKLNISFAVLGTLIGEFISADKGLGHYLFKASGVYDVPRVWFGVVLLSLMIVIMTALADFGAAICRPDSKKSFAAKKSKGR